MAGHDEFSGYSEAAVRGIRHIRSLPSSDVLGAARDTSSAPFIALMTFMGQGTNPNWITGQCAEEAYRRGLIDEVEFDYLSR